MLHLIDIPGPFLLVHPNIPKPLHGLNPRTLMGPEWWDNRRRLAYARFDNRCWACQTHKSKARYKQWLEAHECYFINYIQGTATFMGVCALCHCCHNFIHSGRLQAMFEKRRFSKTKYSAIIKHGNEVLTKCKPRCRYQKVPFIMNEVPLLNNPFVDQSGLRVDPNGRLAMSAPWGRWRLIIQDVSYPTPFPTQESWAAHYYKLKD